MNGGIENLFMLLLAINVSTFGDMSIKKFFPFFTWVLKFLIIEFTGYEFLWHVSSKYLTEYLTLVSWIVSWECLLKKRRFYF